MTTDAASLPDDLRRFLLFAVPSVPFLEALLLFRAEPATAFDGAAVARRLYLDPQAAEALVDALQRAGLVAPAAAGLRYAPADATQAALIDRLAAAYAADGVGLSRLIHAGARQDARRFADAFKLRKDE